MQLKARCPSCQQLILAELTQQTDTLVCSACDWRRPIGGIQAESICSAKCLVCGCPDQWRQKDFPQRLGLLFVGLGALLSTIAWYYVMPLTAICILMAFALIDFVLYFVMSDVLVCYRCESRLRDSDVDGSHPRFDLEVAERYRQEEHRLKTQ